MSISDKTILYIGRNLRPYRTNFLTALSRIGRLHVRVEDGLQNVPLESKGRSASYRNLVLRDKEGYNSRWPNFYISIDLLRELCLKRFDYVILEGTSGSLFLAALICKLKKSKVIVSYERTLHTERSSKNLKRMFHRFYFNYVADGVLSNGRKTNEYLKSVGRAYVIYSRNVFPDKFSDTQNSRHGPYKFLFVGQLIERKGVKYLRDFINFVRKTDAHLTIVGDGPLKDDIQNELLGVSNVNYIHSLDYNSVISLMQSHHYLFMPTLEDNWSLVALEATLNGCVPITTKFNGVTDDLLTPLNAIIYDFAPDFWSKNFFSITNEQYWLHKSRAGVCLNKLDVYADLKRYLSSL